MAVAIPIAGGAALLAALIQAIIIVLIIIAVIAVIYWLVTVAIPWIVETATEIWNTVVVPFAEAVVEKVQDKLEDLAKEIDRTIDKLLKGYKVYQLLMTVPGEYKKRVFGFGWGGKHHFPTDNGGNPTFKYGTTKNTVQSRYATGYIRDELFITKRLSYTYLFTNLNILQARATEKSLILAYYMAHGTMPPGNSKFG